MRIRYARDHRALSVNGESGLVALWLNGRCRFRYQLRELNPTANTIVKFDELKSIPDDSKCAAHP